jgi:GDP-4-dehydro-6-deoxy-D-mannose reductase
MRLPLRRPVQRRAVVVEHRAAAGEQRPRDALPARRASPKQAQLPGPPHQLAQEQLGLRAVDEDGLDVIVARSFNHTGPRQTPAFAAPSIARQIALIERGTLAPVLRVGNLETARDLSDVRDVVRAYSALMTMGSPGTVYNVASGVGRTIRSVLDGLLARSRVPIQIEIDASRLRSNDAFALVGNASRLRQTTGWEPAISFDRMLDDLLEYWRERTGVSA